MYAKSRTECCLLVVFALLWKTIKKADMLCTIISPGRISRWHIPVCFGLEVTRSLWNETSRFSDSKQQKGSLLCATKQLSRQGFPPWLLESTEATGTQTSLDGSRCEVQLTEHFQKHPQGAHTETPSTTHSRFTPSRFWTPLGNATMEHQSVSKASRRGGCMWLQQQLQAFCLQLCAHGKFQHCDVS